MASGDECAHQAPISANLLSESYRCSPENPYISIRKLINIMENPHSEHFVDRQILIIDDFIIACPYAFFLRDLPYIIRLLKLMCERIEQVPKFKEPLKKLLQKCATPPMMCRTSEGLELMKDLSEYFSLFGYLFVLLKDKDLKNLILEAISSILCRKKPVGICCVTLKFCYTALESSQLPEIISQLLELVEEQYYEKMLEIALIISKISHTTCQKMLKENITEYLLLRITNCECDEQSTTVCPNYFQYVYKILWYLLKTLKDSDEEFRKSIKGPSRMALVSLKKVFRYFTLTKGLELDRNTTLAIISLILELFQDLDFTASGLTADLAILCVAAEIGLSGTWASLIRFSADELNYQFKKLLLLAMFHIKKYNSALDILHQRNVVHGLLRIITPELQKSLPWNAQQHCKIIIIALNVLESLIPILFNDFIRSNGPMRLLMMIELYLLETYDTFALQSCLKAFYSLFSVPEFKPDDFFDVKVVTKIFIGICNKILNEKTLSLSIQRCLGYSLCIMECFFERKPMASERAINLCIAYMKRALDPKTEDTVHDPKSIICLLDFLWETFLSDEKNLKLFVTKGGVYKLLDIIQQFVFPVKVIGLGALVDLCESGTCIPHLVTWRGRGKKLIPFLLDIFREENKMLGVKINQKGVIADQELPLMGVQQWRQLCLESRLHDSSPATADLLVSCRPKLYALIQLLETRHKEKVHIANDHYRMFNEVLSYKDQISMLLLENYLALKLGETWVELETDLERSGIRPLAIDAEVIKTLVERYHRWGVHLKNEQERLLYREKQQEESNERALYSILREGRLSSALEALHELEYIARTTENMFRFSRKTMQIQQINKSLYFDETDETQHRTLMYNIKVNPVFNQHVNVQSNKIIDPNEKIVILDPVSSDSEIEQSLKITYYDEYENSSNDSLNCNKTY